MSWSAQKTGIKRQDLNRIEYEETFTSFCPPNYDTKSWIVHVKCHFVRLTTRMENGQNNEHIP